MNDVQPQEQADKPSRLSLAWLWVAGYSVALGVSGALRFVLGVAGLTGFVFGLILAWRTSNSTTLLIVSAVLLLVAALGIDWERVAASVAGNTIELQRRLDETARGIEAGEAGLEAVAAKEEAGPVRDELEEVLAQLETQRAELETLTARLPASRPRVSASEAVASLIGRLRPVARHLDQDGSVQLILQAPDRMLGYHCTVQTPSGDRFSTVTRRKLAGGSWFGGYVTVYPAQFDGVEALVPGTYAVEWHEPGQAPPGTRPLVAALIAALLDRSWRRTRSLCRTRARRNPAIRRRAAHEAPERPNGCRVSRTTQSG
jgi:hypothetical protein